MNWVTAMGLLVLRAVSNKYLYLFEMQSSENLYMYLIFVPRFFEEKRRDMVFDFPSFRTSVFPSFRPPKVRNSSYSFMLILSKFYRCFCYGLKICMWFGYYPEIIFCYFFRKLNIAIFLAFYYQSELIVGTLCAYLPIQFYIDSFDTSRVFWTWSEHMHVVWI